MKWFSNLLGSVIVAIGLIGCGGDILEDTTPSGTLDENFANGDGYRIYNSIGHDDVKKMKIDNNDNIYLVGDRVENTHQYASLYKINTSGNLVSSFGNNGIVKKQVELNKNSWGTSLVINGTNIFFSGAGYELSNNTYLDSAIWKVNANNGSGTHRLILDMPDFSEEINDFVIVNNNFYTATNYKNSTSNYGVKIMRYTNMWAYRVLSLSTQNSQSKSILYYNNKFYVLADVGGFSKNTLIWSLNNDNSLTYNTGFNSTGKIEKDLSLISYGTSVERITSSKIDNNGNIFITGYIDGGSTNHYDLFVAKFKNNGQLDNTFANNGIFTFNNSDFNGDDSGYDLSIDNNGKIVVVGNTNVAMNNKNILILRLNSDGTLDTSFNNTGILKMDLSDSNYEYAKAVGFDSNNKIVVAGSIGGYPTRDIFIMKINP